MCETKTIYGLCAGDRELRCTSYYANRKDAEKAMDESLYEWFNDEELNNYNYELKEYEEYPQRLAEYEKEVENYDDKKTKILALREANPDLTIPLPKQPEKPEKIKKPEKPDFEKFKKESRVRCYYEIYEFELH